MEMLDMLDPEIVTAMEIAAHKMLEWIGFGTLVGLTAKAVMPGRDPGGAFVTLTIGIAGSVIGCGIVAYLGASGWCRVRWSR